MKIISTKVALIILKLFFFKKKILNEFAFQLHMDRRVAKINKKAKDKLLLFNLLYFSFLNKDMTDRERTICVHYIT